MCVKFIYRILYFRTLSFAWSITLYTIMIGHASIDSLKILNLKNQVRQKSNKKKEYNALKFIKYAHFDHYNLRLFLWSLLKPKLYTDLVNIWQDLVESVYIINSYRLWKEAFDPISIWDQYYQSINYWYTWVK